MTLLTTFEPAARVAIIGASGGIGGAFLELLHNDERVAETFAFARDPGKITPSNTVTGRIDFADEASIESAARLATHDGPLDLVLVTTGILHRGNDIRPEKSLSELDAGKLTEVLAINAIGPALVAKHFLPSMRRGQKTVFTALSARVGSIQDNRLGGWASYRASKAALNMLLKTISIEHARRFPRSVIAALHPGTVDSHLSAPFTARVNPKQLFTPQKSARHLLDVIDGLEPENTGGFFAWDGAPIDY